jgi:PAS domain S-box-containing protein
LLQNRHEYRNTQPICNQCVFDEDFDMSLARLLIVDDDYIIATELQETLEMMGYAVVDIVTNGHQAIKQAEILIPDMILMDIRLKGALSGIEAASCIQANLRIPVIFLSAFDDDETIEKAKAAQPYGYLLKPVQDRDLSVTIDMGLYRANLDREKERMVERLEQEANVNSRLARLSTGLVTPGYDLDSFALWLLREVGELTTSRLSCIGLIEAEEPRIIRSPQSGPSSANPEGADSVSGVCNDLCSRQSGLWAHALETMKPLLTNDPGNHPAFKPTNDCPDALEAFLSVPVLIQDRIAALIALANPSRRYSVDDLRATERFGELLNIAIRQHRMEEEKKAFQAQRYPSRKPETDATLSGGSVDDFNDELLHIIGYASAGYQKSRENPKIRDGFDAIPTATRNILVVADDMAEMQQVFDILERLDCQVRPALAADLALQTLEYQLPDLILLEVEMPDMSGFELCRRLKARRDTREIPVIFISKLQETSNILEGFLCGGVDYLTKSIRPQELVVRVQAHLALSVMRRQREDRIEHHSVALAHRTKVLQQTIEKMQHLDEQLKEREADYRLVVDSLQESISVLDSNGFFLFGNRQLKIDLIGDDHKEIIGNNLRDLVPDEQADPFIERCRWILTQQQTLTDEIQITTKGMNRWFRVHFHPIRFGKEKAPAVLSIALDITQQKDTDERLAQKSQELQRLSRRLIRAQEEERRSVSCELHDEVGQALTAMQINLEAIEKEIDIEPSTRVGSRLTECIDLNDQILAQIREICLNLRPSILDDLGLTPTLNWYINRFSQRVDQRVDYHIDPLPTRLTPEVETTFYRGVQEALTNIVKHARAGRINIKLVSDVDDIRLTVVDNGRGFDITQLDQLPDPDRGIGLIGLRERISLLGGRFNLASRPGQGTTLEIFFPIAAEPTISATTTTTPDVRH